MGEGRAELGLPRLPEGFVFGTSTASYQIEGAVAEDGRGPSIWDTFCAEPGRINDASSGAVACDHYHRYRDDVALMAALGVGGYRFSVSWSRVQPTGSGAVNAAGLAFYDRLVDELLAHDVAPMATLYHWDLPQALETASNGEGGGGWMNRDTAERFGEYAAVVAERLGDRVAQWVPVNEPNVASLLGYALGMHAPGKALMFGALPAAHHLLLGHGLATTALRSAGAAAVGTATNHAPMWPASSSAEDRAAADLFDTVWNRIFSDPVLLGRYPDGFGELMGAAEGDLALIGQPLDFYGVNYYNPMCVAAPADPTSEMPFDQREIPGYPKTDFGWPVVPDGLRELLVLMHQRYPAMPPVMITENGCSYATGPDEHGVVDDQARIDYLDGHLGAVAAAIAEGVDVRGYYCWSLMDNFEWTEGYTQRFGLVHVDYETQVRTPKRSFDWYADLVRAHR